MSFFGNKYALAGIAVAATAVGYCIYFDQKRRLAPGFKEKLAESVFKVDCLVIQPTFSLNAVYLLFYAWLFSIFYTINLQPIKG